MSLISFWGVLFQECGDSGNMHELSNFLKPFPALVSSNICLRGFQSLQNFFAFGVAFVASIPRCLNCRALYCAACAGFGYITNSTV